MSRLQFWILNATSLLLAAVIGFEMYSSNQLELAQSLTRQAQLPILQDEQLQAMAHLMIPRIAQGAAADPALKALLVKYGYKVTIQPVANGNFTSSIPPASAAPHP